MQNHPISLPAPIIPWAFGGSPAPPLCLAEAVGRKGRRVKKRARCCLCLDCAALKSDSRVGLFDDHPTFPARWPLRSFC